MPNIQINTQTITQITVVDAEPEKQAEALSMMAERARFMARQPGFVYPFVIMGNTMPPRDPDEDEEDEDKEEEDRADEPPVVREPDEDWLGPLRP